LAESEIAALLLYSGLAIFAAVTDIRARTIPNYLNAIIAVGGLVSVFALGGASEALSASGHLAIALAIGLLVYALGMWGGGDAKFYAASSAWFALGELPRLVLGISLGGLLLVIVWFVGRRLSGKTAHGAKGELPYGVAIAAGGIATMASLAMR
jgi:prepilin peptidase CpaA